MVEIRGRLIPILMQQDPSPQGIRGSLLPAVLQEICRMAQCVQGMATAWSCHIGRSSLFGSYSEHFELPCTLGMECGALLFLATY